MIFMQRYILNSNALNIVYFIDSYAQSKYVNLIYIKKFEELFSESEYRLPYTIHTAMHVIQFVQFI